MLVLLALGNAVRAAEPVLLDGVAAHVNRHTVTIGDVLNAMEPEHRELSGRYAGEELRRRLRAAYADAREAQIDRWVVLDAYEEGEGRIPDWAIAKREDEVIREQFGGDRGGLLDALAREQMTYADWRTRIREQMIVASMRSASVEQNVTVSPEDVAAHYASHRADYQTPARVHLRVLALPGAGTNGTGRVDAEAVWARLRTGEDFGAVAQAVSVGAKAAEGGDWGWVDPAILRPELATAARTVNVGAVSDIIATDKEFYILKVEAREAATTRALADVQLEIESKLRLERSKAGYQEWVARLRQAAYVKVFEASPF